MRHYFNLNIKHAYYDAHRDEKTELTGAAAYWLGGNKALVYFGTETVETINQAKKPIEAFNFIQLGDNVENWDDCVVTTIQNGRIWIYKPAGKVEDGEKISFKRSKNDATDTLDILKTMSVKMVHERPLSISQVPLILASMRVNPKFSLSTFWEIDRKKYIGNIAAIQAATGEWEPGFKVDPLECLSSIELETLIAKLFEAHDCFVPAYKGGFLADVDLFVTPKSRVKLAGLVLNPSKNDKKRLTWSIQVKKSVKLDKLDRRLADWLTRERHLLITLNENADRRHPPVTDHHLNRDWLRDAIAQTPSVQGWLAESLSWLPEEHQSPPLNGMVSKG